MINGHNRTAIEQAIKEQLDARDEVICAQFAEHCATWIDNALVLELCLALINYPVPEWLAERIRPQSPDLSAALTKLYTHIDRHRAEFIEEEAGNRLKVAEAEAIARADFDAETDAESRRLSR